MQAFLRKYFEEHGDFPNEKFMANYHIKRDLMLKLGLDKYRIDGRDYREVYIKSTTEG